MIIEGRVWKFGDSLKSHHFFNGKYDLLARKHKYAELGAHILEDVDPSFRDRVQPGDIFVVGESFGTGKHLWGPIGAFRELGIQAVIAKGLATSWQRNSLNVGYPSIVLPKVYDLVQEGERLRLDLASGEALNLTSEKSLRVEPVDPGIRELIKVGGISALTSRKLGVSGNAE